MRVMFQVGITLNSRQSAVLCRYLAWPSSNPFSAAKRQLPSRTSVRPPSTNALSFSSAGMSRSTGGGSSPSASVPM